MGIKGSIRGLRTPVYKARYCLDVIDFMGRGYSLTAFAGEIGVSRAVLDRWAETHPPFATAVERAEARRARVLEGRLLHTKGGGAVSLHRDALKAAAPKHVRRDGQGKFERRRPAARPELPDNGRE